ncbi:MAG: MarR family transcriptional regulator [Leptospirales bacterium]
MDLETVSTGHLITTAARVILRRYETRQRALGVTPPRSGILLLLNMVGSLSQKEIAAHLFLDKTNLSTLIRDMARDKLVTIETSPEDRRVRVVCIAPAGNKLLSDLQRINHELSAELDSRVSRRTGRALRAFFADLLIDEFSDNPD